MQAWLLLSLAIVSEVIGTSALKSSDGFTRLWPSIMVVVGYGLAFYCLALVLRTIPVGIAYAVWAGTGVALMALVGWLVYGQRLDVPGIVGILLIVAGVFVLNIYSSAGGH
ncbi:QacE family quaternary ammonium compound efflux SMR transporter [Tamilnaduibacter salinus]|uniref:QacE family quaternary ammonium compound efflux SMR transporter n=1 Tax=Tamilnaduibacter salinus TaxID=1484056 RepID=A0A2A2I0U9_9GAMM|nr:SMR family transporter [Tamilnaduibacter salinus]PAV24765.1 QacE family quaternary ammonium compound efflux SMR transporter [Tamilnaduibacter salinus]